MKKIISVEEVLNDDIIYIDTDSCFFSVEKLVRAKYPNADVNNDNQMVDAILKITHDIQVYVNNSMNYFSEKFLHVKNHKFNLKQEIIAKTGFWTSKKRYALWAINIEGRNVDELDVKGLDVVRTSFPKLYRDFMTQMLKDILHGVSKDIIDKNILELKNITNTVHFFNIARPTGVKEISKFTEAPHQPFKYYFKGAPVHVKASVNYNDFIRHFKLDDKYPYIGDNEKIKWVYLIPENPYGLDSMAFKDIDSDPKELLEYIDTYIDRGKIFDSEMTNKLQDFYNSLGWGTIPTKLCKSFSKFFEN